MPQPNVWTGCDQDRVGDYDTLADILKASQSAKGVELGLDIICEFIDSAYSVGFFGPCVDIPNPIKIACVAGLTIARTANLALDTTLDQVDFQNGLVDGAEIQASKCSCASENECDCSPSHAYDAD